MARGASSLAGRALAADASRLHRSTRAPGDRQIVEAACRRTQDIPCELAASEIVALDGEAVARVGDRSMLQLLAKTLMELALFAGTTARSETDRHLCGCALSSMGNALGVVAAEMGVSVNGGTEPTELECRDVGRDAVQELTVIALVADTHEALPANEQHGDRWT
jgi:hypothetical protein